MRLFFSSTVFVVLSISFLEVHTYLFEKEYPQLISDIYHLYDTSSVLIIHNSELENIAAIGRIFSIVQWLSIAGISSMTSNIEQLAKVQSFYTGVVKQQLYVVLLREYETIKAFENVMQNVIVSDPIWLVIFEPSKIKNLLNDYCSNPRGNPFNLAFNTQMLIKCYDDHVIKEWYSMFENQTEVYDLASWNAVDRLKLLNDKSIHQRRSQIGGISLRMVAVHGSTLVEDRLGKLGGVFGNIVEELSHSMNFKIKQIQKEIIYGSWDPNTGAWSGVMKQLHQKNADFATADMAMSTRRLKDVDFTIPLITSRVVLCFKEPNITSIQQLGYFQTFNYKIWSTLVVLIVTTSIFLTIIKVKMRQSYNLRILLCENYLNIWQIFCQQGLTEFPKLMSVRLVYFSIFITALIISSVYSASLISFLTSPTTVLPFTTLEGFVNDGSYKLIVLKDSVHHDIFRETNDQLLRRMRKLMKVESKLPKTEIEALKQVCRDKTAFYSTEDTIISQKHPPNCKLTWIQTGEINCLSIPISKGNQYTGIMNFHLKRFLDNGMMDYLKRKKTQNNCEKLKTQFNVVTFSSIAPILNIVLIGIALSISLFIVEKIYFLYDKKRQ